jgi:bacteriocin biosynthesis cyclodehydratase domain-containing protein
VLRAERRLLQLHLLLLLRGVNEHLPTVPPLPLLKPWYRLLCADDRVLLEHGRTTVVFEGSAARSFLPALLQLLDGTRSVDAICEQIGPRVRPAVENALGLLAQNGLLIAGPRLAPDAGARDVAESLVAASLSPAPVVDVAARLRTSAVRVLGDEGRCDELARLLQRSGVSVLLGEPEGEDRALVVVGPGADRERWNGVALETGCHWLPFGEFDGLIVTVGPLIVPRETACFECFRLRRESTSGCPEELALLRDVAEPAPPRPSLFAAACAIAADIVVRWIGAKDPTLPGVVYTIGAEEGLSISAHDVLRVPRCPACSLAANVAPPSPWHEAQAA